MKHWKVTSVLVQIFCIWAKKPPAARASRMHYYSFNDPNIPLASCAFQLVFFGPSLKYGPSSPHSHCQHPPPWISEACRAEQICKYSPQGSHEGAVVLLSIALPFLSGPDFVNQKGEQSKKRRTYPGETGCSAAKPTTANTGFLLNCNPVCSERGRIKKPKN